MKLRIGIFTLLLITAAFLIWSLGNEEETKAPAIEVSQHVKPNSEVSSIAKQIESSDKPVFQVKAECEPINDEFAKANHKWEEQIYEYIYLKRNEYDEDLMIQATTLTMPYAFLSYESHLFQKLYRKSEDAKKLSAQRRQVRKDFGQDYFKGRYIDWLFVATLQESESADFIEKYKPDVESIIDLILNYENDSLVAKSLSETPYLSRKAYGSSHQKGSSVFDALVSSGKSSLLDIYFNTGGEFKKNEYGVNSLEKILVYTPFEKLQDKVQAIKTAVDLGQTVRYNIVNERFMNLGQFHTMRMRLSESDLEKYEVFGFKFSQAKTLEDLKKDALVLDMKEKLDTAKFAFLKSKLDIENLEQQKYCESVDELAKSLLHDVKNDSLISEVFEYNKDDLDQLREELFRVEPGLNDCYFHPDLNHKHLTPMPAADRKRTQDLALKFGKEDPFSAIEAATASNLSDSEKSQLFWQVIRFTPNHAKPLLDNGFYPSQSISHSAAEMKPEVFKLLHDNGFDFNVSSEKERTLVEVASAQCNFDLIDALYEAGYEYQTDKKRADALAIAIRYKNCFPHRASTNKKVKLIRSIMQFKPEIMEYHKKRMAELRLSDMDVYNTVVDAFPQLAISDSVKPAGVFCSQIRFPNGDLANYRGH